MLGLEIDVPIEKAVSRLASHGVAVRGSVVRSDPGNFVHVEDPDGNEIYLWEKAPQLLAHSEVSSSTAKG
jgi:predicted enzyme related to lactoylglutathione lyase